ncbi:MAG: Na(+)/H(+) antiporter subunit B [Halanaerobiales bacterium]
MIVVLEYLLMFFLVLSAVLAVHFRRAIISIIFLSIFSIVLTSLYIIHTAPDVALAEAVIGAGFNTALFMTAISQVKADGEDKSL